MNSGEKGKVAELLVAAQLIEKGYTVSCPLHPCRYDLVIEKNNKFYRVQVKYIGKATSRTTVAVMLHSICRSGRKYYSESEIDVVVAYYEPDSSFFVIPYSFVAGKTALNIRLKKAANSQKVKVVPREEFENRWDLIGE